MKHLMAVCLMLAMMAGFGHFAPLASAQGEATKKLPFKYETEITFTNPDERIKASFLEYANQFEEEMLAVTSSGGWDCVRSLRLKLLKKKTASGKEYNVVEVLLIMRTGKNSIKDITMTTGFVTREQAQATFKNTIKVAVEYIFKYLKCGEEQ